MDETRVNPLDYARAPSTRRRRRLQLLVVAVVILAWALWDYGPRVWINVQFLFHQRQWANCEMPAGQVLFDTNIQLPPQSKGRFLCRYIPGTFPDCRKTFPQIAEMSGTLFLHLRKSA